MSNFTNSTTTINSTNTIVNNSNSNHLTPPPVNPKYNMQKKQLFLNQRLHGRKFFDSADWAITGACDLPVVSQDCLISKSPSKAH